MTIGYRLAREEALTRVKRLLLEVKEEHGDKISNLREAWNDSVGTFSFDAMGFSVSGIITVNDKDIAIDGKLPFAVGLFKGEIESTIRERANKLLP